MKQTNQKLSIFCLYAANALVYAFNALFYCLLPLYFNDRFEAIEAGIVLSVGPAVSMVAPVFWGMLADRAKYKNTVLIIAILISAGFFFSLGGGAGFFVTCILVGLTMLFMSPFAGLIDTITLEYTAEAGLAYGPIRVMGTIGFGIIALVSSFFAGISMDFIFYLYIAMALICALALLFCPKVAGHANRDAAKATGKAADTDIRPLLRAKRLWIIVAFMLLCQFAYSYYCNFFPTYLRDTLGQPQWLWGLNVLILVLGEIPFFFLYNKLFEKIGIWGLMMIVMVGSALRYALLGVCGGVPAIIAINLLTGFLVTVITYCGAMYITRYIPAPLQATGQNLMYCIGQGIARVFGGVLGGVIDDRFSTTGGMLLFGILLAAGAVGVLFVGILDRSPEWKRMDLRSTENNGSHASGEELR